MTAEATTRKNWRPTSITRAFVTPGTGSERGAEGTGGGEVLGMASRRRCGWTGQFYNLRAGSHRSAAFSGWWKVADLRAGQRHASVQGTVPRRKESSTCPWLLQQNEFLSNLRDAK
ncbi:Ubiquitin Carboxyl-Terminal Hydrolase 26 [Manis pentadactyla]|nr:Ubiquitin Carboxyl-Terminal Hydrolase 26 [Manis pentadactyla]